MDSSRTEEDRIAGQDVSTALAPGQTGTMENGTSPQTSKPHIGYIPQSDSGICLTPQGQGDTPSPLLEKEDGVAEKGDAPSAVLEKETGIRTTVPSGTRSPQQEKERRVCKTAEEKNDVQYPSEPENAVSGLTSGQATASGSEEQGNCNASLPQRQSSGTAELKSGDSTSVPFGQSAQSSPENKQVAASSSTVQHEVDSCSTSHSQGQPVEREEGEEVRENHEEPPPFVPRLVTESPSSSSPSLNSSSASLRHGSSSPTKGLKVGSNASSDSRSPTPDPSKSSRSPRHGALSPDDFAHQTKYLVLQFLHQATSEQHLLHLSQTSLSTTSESEPRCRSYAETLRQRWQDNRSQSSPTSPHPQLWPKPLAKTKGSRSSPNLKDANFFKDIPEMKSVRGKRSRLARSSKGSKRSPKPPRRSPVQVLAQDNLIRSVSQTTDGSEHGPYDSDADDELDSSFDSSHHGSATSLSFRNKLAHFHQQRLPTVHSESESLADASLNTADEGTVSAAEDGRASPILRLEMINVEQQPVSPTTQYARVNQYLVQMSEASVARFQIGGGGGTDTPGTPLDGDGDEVDSPPFNFLSHPEQAVISGGELTVPLDPTEEGAVSGGFEPDDAFFDQPEETEGACGGTEPEEGAGGGWQSARPDRSGLRLDLTEVQETVVLMDAVQTLHEVIEEEMTSFDSEFEEAINNLQSDHSHATGLTLSHSRSFSPETAEAARILARIGDEVQQRYFDHLDRAVGRFMLDNCAGLFTYENFRAAALMALDKDLNGWKQVATLLLYSQHVALQLAQTGGRNLHRVVDYTVQLLADTYADFIITQGGWAGISSQEHSSSPSSPDYTGPIPFSSRVDASTDTTMIDNTQDRRRSSAPNLTSAFQPSTPDDSLSLDSTDHTITANSPASLVGGAEGEATTASLASGSEVGSPASVVPEADREGEKKEEGDGGGGLMSTVGNAVFGSGLLTRAAVSVGVLAVGAAFAFSLTRG